MITKPILIIGAPRSGTSMLQKILRDHPGIWSLPSESDMLWDQYCHPKLNNWASEKLTESDINDDMITDIRSLFERYLAPSSFWSPIEKSGVIWGFHRAKTLRRLIKPIYQYGYPILSRLSFRRNSPKRIVEKTASNCFRLGFVNEVFPDAKIIYVTRDGRNNINSLINGWLNPDRFFSYDLPRKLSISGYPHNKWKFVLPPGWEKYTNKSLEEVCAFQWISCHQNILSETAKQKYKGRVLQVKLEDISDNPEEWIRKIVEFVDMPFDDYFESLCKSLPIINSPDQNVSKDKWLHQNRELVERVIPLIQETQKALGYE